MESSEIPVSLTTTKTKEEFKKTEIAAGKNLLEGALFVVNQARNQTGQEGGRVSVSQMGKYLFEEKFLQASTKDPLLLERSIQYLFTNLDSQGKLENEDYLAQEDSLQRKDTRRLLGLVLRSVRERNRQHYYQEEIIQPWLERVPDLPSKLGLTEARGAARISQLISALGREYGLNPFAERQLLVATIAEQTKQSELKVAQRIAHLRGISIEEAIGRRLKLGEKIRGSKLFKKIANVASVTVISLLFSSGMGNKSVISEIRKIEEVNNTNQPRIEQVTNLPEPKIALEKSPSDDLQKPLEKARVELANLAKISAEQAQGYQLSDSDKEALRDYRQGVIVHKESLTFNQEQEYFVASENGVKIYKEASWQADKITAAEAVDYGFFPEQAKNKLQAVFDEEIDLVPDSHLRFKEIQINQRLVQLTEGLYLATERWAVLDNLPNGKMAFVPLDYLQAIGEGLEPRVISNLIPIPEGEHKDPETGQYILGEGRVVGYVGEDLSQGDWYQNKRTTIQIGAAKLNGRQIQPGEQFSLLSNLNLSSNEYPVGKAYTGKGELFNVRAGGACAIGTAFARGATDAGLEINKQFNHARPSYGPKGQTTGTSPLGLEATLFDSGDPQSSKDVEITNNSGQPLTIKATVERRSGANNQLELRIKFLVPGKPEQNGYFVGPYVVSPDPGGELTNYRYYQERTGEKKRTKEVFFSFAKINP